MTIGCNIGMICLNLNWFFYGLSRMLQFSQFEWALSYSVWDVFNKFFLIDATDISKIISDQKRFFIALSLYPLSFFANTPFKKKLGLKHSEHEIWKKYSTFWKINNVLEMTDDFWKNKWEVKNEDKMVNNNPVFKLR